MATKTVAKKPKQETATEKKSAAGSPFAPLMDLRDRMDHLFDDVMSHWHRPSSSRRLFDPDVFGSTWPSASWSSDLLDVKFDVSDSEEAVEISAELPGMKEDEVDVALSDGVLTIKGEKKIERQEKKKDYFLTERQHGTFRRAFRVPDTVDDEKITASFESGVLHVTLPRRPEAKAKQKKISISTR